MQACLNGSRAELSGCALAQGTPGVRAHNASEVNPVTRTGVADRIAAELLRHGKIIGWCRGAMEFGPRALGHRCILASPTDVSTTYRINISVKRRETFRPLAPAVLAEHAAEYFDLEPAGADVYPYMLATAPARADRRNRIPAVVHIDGSARVQTVTRTANLHFWELLDAYRVRTGLPVLLNTSLNHAEEPIARTADDAIRTYLRCGLDALIVGDYVIERTTQ